MCVGVGQPEPAGHGAVVRCIVDSLALKYRYTIELLTRVAGVAPAEVHVVGGGARNELLCQSVADATGLPVLAGPEEATVVGNLLGQAIALGELSSLEEARAIVRGSFEPRVFEPTQQEEWGVAYERFREVVGGMPNSAEQAAVSR